MNWKKVLNWIFGILLLVSLIFNGYSFYQLRHLDAPEAIKIYQKDTILITKTDTCWKDNIIYKTKHDTLIFYEHDSITDTIKIEIPIEHKKYSFKTEKDSMKIEGDIYYHGYKAEIDTVGLKYDFNYSQPLKRKKFGWGITVGPSISYTATLNNQKIYCGPSVGISVVIGPSYIIK